MDEKPRKPAAHAMKGPAVALAAAAILLAPVLYVLSIGPTFRLAIHAGRPGGTAYQAWEAIYWPVTSIAGQWEPAGDALKWYLFVWS